jgi:DNA-binding MarR family transcriptional regulator
MSYDGGVVKDSQPVEAVERSRLDASEVSWAVRAVVQAATDADVELARRLRMRPMDYAAVGHVMTAAPPIGPLQLSHSLGISSGSATELVDRLERSGHLQRHRDEVDRRRVTLSLTPTAVDRILAELRPIVAAMDAVAADLTPAEQQVVTRFLRQIASALTAYADEGRP